VPLLNTNETVQGRRLLERLLEHQSLFDSNGNYVNHCPWAWSPRFEAMMGFYTDFNVFQAVHDSDREVTREFFVL
jgi:hypothetical protein